MGRLEAGRLESLKAYKFRILSASQHSGFQAITLKELFTLITKNQSPLTPKGGKNEKKKHKDCNYFIVGHRVGDGR